MNIFDTAVKFLTDNATAIGAFLAIVLAIAKTFSNTNAGPIIATIQGAVDMVAKLVMGLGDLLHAVSSILANAIKSDGLLGKK